MDSRHLHLFITVAECGSFSEAARRLHIAQPALSRQIQQLERAVRMPLFVRTVKGVALTDGGERLFPYASAIVRQINAIGDVVSDQNSAVAGRVTIGIPTTASAILSKPLLDAARSALPNVQLHLVESMSGFLAQWLEQGSLDLSLLYDPEPSSNLELEGLLTEELVLVGAHGAFPEQRREIPFRELENYPLVMPGKSHALRQLVDSVATRQNRRLKILVEIDSLSVMKSEIRGGDYFAVLAPAAVREEIRDRTFQSVDIVEPCISRTVSLACSSPRGQTRASREVARLIVAVAHRLLGDGSWKGAPCYE